MAEPRSSARKVPRDLALKLWGSVGVLHLPVEALPRFVRWHMWRLTKPFTLVTGDSDLSVCTEHVGEEVLGRLLANPLLVAWYAQNLTFAHPKLHPLPIGMDYHTLAHKRQAGAGHCWGHHVSPVEQEQHIQQVHFEAGSLAQKTCQAFSNWHFARERGNREECLREAPRASLFLQPDFLPRQDSWRLNAEYAFTCSPTGNGLDCHRTWEAMLLGSIPVVVSTSLDPLYADLPVLILKSWSELTPERLLEERDRFTQGRYDFSRLTLRYWMDRVYGRQGGPSSWMTMEEFRLSMAPVPEMA